MKVIAPSFNTLKSVFTSLLLRAFLRSNGLSWSYSWLLPRFKANNSSLCFKNSKLFLKIASLVWTFDDSKVKFRFPMTMAIIWASIFTKFVKNVSSNNCCKCSALLSDGCSGCNYVETTANDVSSILNLSAIEPLFSLLFAPILLKVISFTWSNRRRFVNRSNPEPFIFYSW